MPISVANFKDLTKPVVMTETNLIFMFVLLGVEDTTQEAAARC